MGPADEEQKSISQVCELFLKGTVENYKKYGPAIQQRPAMEIRPGTLALNDQCTGPATSTFFKLSLMLTLTPLGTKDWQDRCR